MQDFLTVAEQVAVLFILISVGYICGKFQIIREDAAKVMADIVLYFATPCVIIQSFQREYHPELLTRLLVSLAASLGIHVFSIIAALLLFRDRDEARRKVLRFAAVFSNAGFMALPLQQAVLGADGVFYGAAYVAVFNLVIWSWGLIEVSGSLRTLSVKKLVFNPGVIGLVVGFILFLSRITLPEIIAAPVGHLANLNTPLPMLIIGFHLSHTSVKTVLRDHRALFAVFIRLVAVPLVMLGLLWLCGIRGTMLVAFVIAVSAPVAAATTMFATKYGADTSLSVNLVSLSTLLSILTMPLIVALSKVIS